MFENQHVKTASAKTDAESILDKIYKESPQYWPHGLHAGHFDDGLYLVREKRSSTPVGFVGFQIRNELVPMPSREKSSHRIGKIKTGYYSIGILPEYRQNGYAKEAVSKLLAEKAGSVDRVRALVVDGNTPSIQLAKSLNVPVDLRKRAKTEFDKAAAFMFTGRR